MKPTRRIVLTLPLLLPGLARAQDHPIRLIVNGTPGSATDLLMRTLGEGLSRRLGRPVIADNRAGAGGFASALAARGAPADGSVLIHANIGVAALAPIVFRKPPIDPDRELLPVAHLTDTPFGLAVRPDAAGGGTLSGWLGAMRDRQGAAIAVNSATGLPRFAVHLLASQTGQPFTPVIYRSSGAMIPDLEAGHVPAGMTIGAEFIQQHRAGTLRLIAQSQGEGRWEAAAEVPRFNEEGVDFVGSAWNALFAPPGTPAALAETIAHEVTEVLAADATRARLLPLGLEPTGGSPASLTARVAADRARWAPVIKASGFIADEP
jgi:tripartite-type tricarboxylate transporter receptor subunit TctC